MPLSIKSDEKNNIKISDDIVNKMSGSISIKGSGNSVSIAGSNNNAKLDIHIEGNSNEIEISENFSSNGLFLYLRNNSKIKIGNMCGFNSSVRIMCHEDSSVSVGDGCLFANDIDIITSDMHSIIDTTTEKRINFAKNIVIDKKVWVGARTTILKGVHIGEGSIVGTGSIVTRDIPAFSISAGNPAKIIKEGVTWDFRLL